MKTILHIARRDIVATVFTRSFLLFNLMMPLFGVVLLSIFAGAAALPELLGSSDDDTSRVLIVVEPTAGHERLAHAVTRASADWATTEESNPNVLDQLVASEEIAAWVNVEGLASQAPSWSWHGTSKPTRTVERQISEVVRAVALAQALAPQSHPAASDAILDAGDMTFVEVNVLSTDPSPASSLVGMFGATTLLYGVIMAGFLGAGRVAQEQQTGLISLLACAATPAQVVCGKTIAAMVISLATIGLWVTLPATVGLIAVLGFQPDGASSTIPTAASLASLPPVLIIWAFLFACHGFGLLAIMVSTKVVQGSAALATVTGFLPIVMILAFSSLQGVARDDPTGPLWTAITLIPGLGGTAAFTRFQEGGHITNVALSGASALVMSLAIAATIVWLNRARMVLGGWPRSMSQLRAALATA